MTTRLGILLSGRGSNFLAIADAISRGVIPNAEIAIVLSNRKGAPGLAAAQARGLPAVSVEARNRTREAQDQELLAHLRKYKVDLVCLAGYMRLLSPAFIDAYRDRILNIHPSLLPAFPGLDAQKQAVDYGVEIAGCTVHFVDEQLDHGVIVMQRAVSVMPDDDAHSLAERILAVEHELYPQAIARVLSDTYKVEGRRYMAKYRQSTGELMRLWLEQS